MTNPNASQVRVYRAADAPPGALAGESGAVLGYGHLGRTAALNLRDSGAKVRIGNREDEYAEQARAEGFEVVPITTAAVDDVVYVLLPDEVIPSLFDSEIAPVLRPGSAIAFGSGYSLAFGLIHPPETIDVLLVAPRMAGSTARNRYLAGHGFWACVGVEANRSGRAEQRMLGLADGMGVLRAGAVQMSAKVEGTLDLFIEQTVGSVLGMAIMMAFEVARDAGIPAEALVLEMYMSGEMEAVFQSFRETGFFRASEDHGPTAVFGGITRSLEMDREAMAESFRKTLEDIKSGGFAPRLPEETPDGYPLAEFAPAPMHGGPPPPPAGGLPPPRPPPVAPPALGARPPRAVRLLRGLDLLEECPAGGAGPALIARRRGHPRVEGPRVPVAVRVGVGRVRDRPFPPDLPLEHVPVEDERRARIRGQGQALGALAIRVEDEPAQAHVEAPADHHPDGRTAVGVDGGQGHRGRRLHHGPRLLEPLREERERIDGQDLGEGLAHVA